MKDISWQGAGETEALLFSTANPLFLRISATVTTVEIAVKTTLQVKLWEQQASE